jgi:CDP-paratose 2-epimerase
VAWFAIAAVTGQPITIFGDGKQVRDVLFVEDLVESFLLAYEHRNQVAGEILNIGGGPRNVLSLLELIDILERRVGITITPSFEGWRPGDQKIFVSDVRKALSVLGWSPKTPVDKGVAHLVSWVEQVKERFR